MPFGSQYSQCNLDGYQNQKGGGIRYNQQLTDDMRNGLDHSELRDDHRWPCKSGVIGSEKDDCDDHECFISTPHSANKDNSGTHISIL